MLTCQRDAFTLPEDVHYLNCASKAPLLKTVEAAGMRGMFDQRLPLAACPEEYFAIPDALRVAVGGLINCDPVQIAITPSVSYGVAIAAHNLQLNKRQNIVTVEEEFPSDVYPWIHACAQSGATHRIVARAPSATQWSAQVLEHIDNQTALVCLSTVHWTDGICFDVAGVAKRCREVGALFVLDGTQSIGAIPFDFQKIQPDLLICAGYKWLLGPSQVGFAAVGERLQNGQPFEHHWSTRAGSEDTSNTAYHPSFRPGARRFDVGEQANPITVPMLTAGIEQVQQWGIERIGNYLEQLAQYLHSALPEEHFMLPTTEDRGPHILGVRARDTNLIPAVLDRLKAANVMISRRGDVLRVSPHLHCAQTDLDVLVDCLQQVSKARG